MTRLQRPNEMARRFNESPLGRFLNHPVAKAFGYASCVVIACAAFGWNPLDLSFGWVLLGVFGGSTVAISAAWTWAYFRAPIECPRCGTLVWEVVTAPTECERCHGLVDRCDGDTHRCTPEAHQ